MPAGAGRWGPYGSKLPWSVDVSRPPAGSGVCLICFQIRNGYSPIQGANGPTSRGGDWAVQRIRASSPCTPEAGRRRRCQNWVRRSGQAFVTWVGTSRWPLREGRPCHRREAGLSSSACCGPAFRPGAALSCWHKPCGWDTAARLAWWGAASPSCGMVVAGHPSRPATWPWSWTSRSTRRPTALPAGRARSPTGAHRCARRRVALPALRHRGPAWWRPKLVLVARGRPRPADGIEHVFDGGRCFRDRTGPGVRAFVVPGHFDHLRHERQQRAFLGSRQCLGAGAAEWGKGRACTRSGHASAGCGPADAFRVLTEYSCERQQVIKAVADELLRES